MEKPIGICLALIGHLLMNLAHVFNLHIHGILLDFFLLRGVYVRSDGLVSHLVYVDHTTKLSNLVCLIWPDWKSHVLNLEHAAAVEPP